MARVTFREIRKRGNYIMCDYERTPREAEFEGTSSEVSRLISTTSAIFMLPGIKDLRTSLLSPSGKPKYLISEQKDRR